jgi:hypothetical protein
MFKHLVLSTVVLACGISQGANEGDKTSPSKKSLESTAKIHPCATDALSKALPLLKLHAGYSKSDYPIEDKNINKNVKAVGTTKLLVGKGVVDVLEVTGYIYRSTYRMRFLYAKIPGTCVLMGQELFEASNPH